MRKAYDLAYWDPAKFRDMVGHARDQGMGYPQYCWMTPEDYSDVRKFGRDVLDLSSDPTVWSTGNMGSVYGVAVMAGRKYPHRGVVSFFAAGDVPLSHVMNARRWATDAVHSSDHSLLFHAGSFSVCPDRDVCLPLLVIGS